MGESSEAVRTDRRTGAVERTAFAPCGAGTEQVYVISHDPPGVAGGAVLICSSILVDLLANYLREAHLARELAASGLFVLRFHYRGTGNSDLDAADMTLQTMEHDACWARDGIQDQLGDVPLAFVGTRWGAITALAAAADHPGAPVVLVEPILDIRRFFREAMRAKRMSWIAAGSIGPAPGDMTEIMATDGFVDVLGDIIHRRFHDSVTDHDAFANVEPDSRPALVVQMGGRELRTEYRTLLDRLTSLGWTAEGCIVEVQESWWFREGLHDAIQTGLTAPVAGWLRDQFPRSAA